MFRTVLLYVFFSIPSWYMSVLYVRQHFTFYWKLLVGTSITTQYSETSELGGQSALLE